ncbi:hypothetical protein M9458_050204, partial [Cirrhinus mrigala]
GPVLRSAMHGRRTLSKHGSDEAENQPQAKKKKIDLIFKDVLEASLEANQSQNNPLNSTLSFQRARTNPDAESKESIFASGLASMEHHESGTINIFLPKLREVKTTNPGHGHAEIKPLPPSEPLPSEDLRGRFAPGMERYHG